MRTLHLLALLLCTAIAAPAYAQRTDDNAVDDANDAFGRSIGGEQIGIYSPENVRGFSPMAAGNVRIEGLYFDQQSWVTDRVLEARTVHVGISAQGYPFPAPTGIANYSLRRPGGDAVASVGLVVGPYGGHAVEIDTKFPLIGEKLGAVVGFGRHRPVTDFGGTPEMETFGLSLRFQPSSSFSVQPFYGRFAPDEETQPLIFTSGDFLPKEYKRGKFYGQKWAKFEGEIENAGVVSRGQLAGFDIALGLFNSQMDVDRNVNDLLFDTDRDGTVGNRVAVAQADNRFESTSGELRVSRNLIEGPRRHSVHLSLRGRDLKRRYGGASVMSLGESVIGEEDFRDEPDFQHGEKSRDRVRQKTAGVGYELRWRNLGELSVGVQKTDYSKRVTTPSGELPESKDSPWLVSATAAAYVTKRLAVYGGYTRGMEESDVAPANAINRNEAPPALKTRQQDFGIRYAIRSNLSLIAGYFDVEKPYFNLDQDSRYRQLGDVSNRGIELSLAGQLAKGLTAVAGATYIDSKVSGDEVKAGLIGERPIGAFAFRTLGNVNWHVPWHEPLTLTARFESTSDRTANRANTIEIPARWILSLGGRYRTSVGKTPVLIRATVDNVFDTFGWNVGPGGFFIPNGKRRFSLVAAADF